MPTLDIVSNFRIDKPPRNTPLVAGAVYLKDSPVEVTAAEAAALLEHFGKYVTEAKEGSNGDAKR